MKIYVKEIFHIGPRNFTFGINGAESTYDALIKYQAMASVFTLHFFPLLCKRSP